MIPATVNEIANDQTSMYGPGHRTDQDAQCTRCISNTRQKSKNDRCAQDRFQEIVFGIALVVYILEHRPDDARKEEHQWRWPE
jgi:hypothetical protein